MIRLDLLRKKQEQEHLLHLIEHAQNVIDQAVRYALADASIKGDVAWVLDSALSGVEQSCRVTRSRIAPERFEEAA